MPELTRFAIAVARDVMALPENERCAFAEVIAQRAAEWRRGQAEIWPIVVRVEQDPRVGIESY